MRDTVILAFSGGLDTSFCVPWLREKGFDVITMFVDTGGTPAEERDYIERRAKELGAVEHVTLVAAQNLWDEFVVPLVQFNAAYQDQYPMLCSDRYVIVRKGLELCRKHNTRFFAHGCTGMGNDQIRFDQTVRSLGDFVILAPIREIQHEHTQVRAYEQAYLKERGFEVRPKTGKYTINENILGVTTSGGEIDDFKAPEDDTWVMCAHPSQWPRSHMRLTVSFDEGVATAINGEELPGPQILMRLNRTFGAYGVGRRLYTGNSTIGLKARIVFECPGIEALLTAHRALEDAVHTTWQSNFKRAAAEQWAQLVYKGFFYEPLKYDLEAFLRSSQRFVNGDCTLETWGGAVYPVAIESEHILTRPGAAYAQQADWTVTEAEGFIKLFGQSSTLSALVNPMGEL